MIRSVCQRTRKCSSFHLLNDIDTANMCICCSAGGIIILNSTGKIDINNTFEERLRLLETDGLPTVRATLFGENKNRRFKD